MNSNHDTLIDRLFEFVTESGLIELSGDSVFRLYGGIKAGGYGSYCYYDI